MQLSKEQLDKAIVDLEGDPIPRDQERNPQTGKIETTKVWTYRGFLLSIVHTSTEKDKNGDLLWSAGQSIASCRNGHCEISTEEANALITALNGSDRFGLGVRMPVSELLNGKSNGEVPKTE